VGLKLNGTHQLLAYVDDVNLLGDNTNTVKKNTETLTDVIKHVPVYHQNAGQFHGIKLANIFFEIWHSSNIQINSNKLQFDSRGSKRKLILGDACYRSIFSSAV
jgi:hypothetical protein